ncbi:MAG: bacteriohemerythrin [Bacteroidales bacterium]|nr:bacteriohemerythrin [Bacteroidales bacterium]
MPRVFVLWNKSYSVGIEKIDTQHKKLIDVLNTLYESFVDQTTGQKLEEILHELLSYTDYHFKTEEELFEKYNYPNKDAHIAEHQEFIKRVVGFNEKFSQGKSTLTFQLMNFLRNWLINHICGSDQKYVSHFSENNIK